MKTSLIIIAFILNISHNLCFAQKITYKISTNIISYKGNNIKEIKSCELGENKIGESNWNVSLKKYDLNDTIGQQLDYNFELKDGCVSNIGFAIDFKIEQWDKRNMLFAPAALYNGNRFKSISVGYPPYIADEHDKHINMPITVSNIPRLNSGGISEVELLTSNCATPMLCFYNPKLKRGFILLTDPKTHVGESGFYIQENLEEGKILLRVMAPGVRKRRYVMCGFVPSNDKGVAMKKGDITQIRLQLWDFPAKGIADFYEKCFSVRKSLSGKNIYVNRNSFSHTVQSILEHHDKEKWYEDSHWGYICNKPNADSPFGHIQTGWSGIPVYALPQAICATKNRVQRVVKSMNVLSEMQGKSGLFYAMSKKGVLFGDKLHEMKRDSSISLVRRTGLSLYTGIQIREVLRVKKEIDESTLKSWDRMFQKAANGLVNLWKQYGEFGQFIDVETGKPDIFNSTAGAINIGALARAYAIYKTPVYLQIAKEAANYYYDHFLMNGYLGGGPAEILQCPDSESAAEYVESLLTLYEITGEDSWLEKGKSAAAFFSSWVVSYDYDFPKRSDLGRISAKSAGSVWASVQNEHSAPGIYILSGDFLFKLYRATGDERYAELLKDIVHNVVQYVNMPNNSIIPDGEWGSVSERVNLSDWEGSQNIGMVARGDSNMAWETVALLSMLQNPGIYVQTDTEKILVLDHVEAIIKSRTEKELLLEIKNPTSESAEVSIFSEKQTDALKPLDFLSYSLWKKVQVGANETALVKIKNNGKLNVLK